DRAGGGRASHHCRVRLRRDETESAWCRWRNRLPERAFRHTCQDHPRLSTTPLRALIFDVDGTLAETEELHRAAFNASFQACGFDWHWDKALYGDLLQITGGKERIAAYMDRHRPEKSASAKLRIGELHARKTEHYTALVETGEVALRPGIERLLREAMQHSVLLGIATTTSLPTVRALLNTCLGPKGTTMFAVISAGDEVTRKKPDPHVYELTLRRPGLSASDCVAVEDSRNGLLAAHAAGIATIVTPSVYTAADDCSEALAVLSDLGEPDRPYRHIRGLGQEETHVSIATLFAWTASARSDGAACSGQHPPRKSGRPVR